jgi:hypothetical protein
VLTFALAGLSALVSRIHIRANVGRAASFRGHFCTVTIVSISFTIEATHKTTPAEPIEVVIMSLLRWLQTEKQELRNGKGETHQVKGSGGII